MSVGRKFSTLATFPYITYIKSWKATEKIALSWKEKQEKQRDPEADPAPQHRDRTHFHSPFREVKNNNSYSNKSNVSAMTHVSYSALFNVKVLLVAIAVTLADWLPPDYIQMLEYSQPTELCWLNYFTGTEKYFKHEL